MAMENIPVKTGRFFLPAVEAGDIVTPRPRSIAHKGVPASGPTLMARDRIVSGLSRAVIIVEAAERSGTMDTAKRAIAQGRLLFAVPGSPGTRLLLAGKAEPVGSATADMDALAQRIRCQPVDPTDTPQLGLGL